MNPDYSINGDTDRAERIRCVGLKLHDATTHDALAVAADAIVELRAIILEAERVESARRAVNLYEAAIATVNRARTLAIAGNAVGAESAIQRVWAIESEYRAALEDAGLLDPTSLRNLPEEVLDIHRAIEDYYTLASNLK